MCRQRDRKSSRVCAAYKRAACICGNIYLFFSSPKCVWYAKQRTAVVRDKQAAGSVSGCSRPGNIHGRNIPFSPPPSSFGSSLCALLVCAGEPLLLLLLLSSSSRNFSNVCEYCRNAHVYEENSVAFYGGTKQAAEMEFRYGGCFYKKTEII